MEDNNALLEYAKEYQGSIGVPQNEEALGAWINDKSNQKYIIDHMKAMNPDQYEEYDALKKKAIPKLLYPLYKTASYHYHLLIKTLRQKKDRVKRFLFLLLKGKI